MHTALKATSSWIASQDQLDPQTLSCFLQSITSDRVGRYRYARLAGASSAILQHGYAAEIREQSTPHTPAISKPTDEQAIQIRSHNDPAHAALRALALLTSLDETTVTGLTLDQVIDGSPALSVGGCWLAGAAGAALRAHHANQSASGLFAPTDPLFTRRQLTHHQRAGENRERTHKLTAGFDIQLAALRGPLDLTKRQPTLSTTRSTPARDVYHEAALIIRLLRLRPTSALPLARLENGQQKAAQRLIATGALRKHQGGLIGATERLRFSHFLADTTRYIVQRTAL